jgi:hypothetical protein
MQGKTKIIIAVVVVALGLAGLHAYRKIKASKRKPVVKVVSVDWGNNTAVITIDGIQMNLDAQHSVMSGNGQWSVNITSDAILLKNIDDAVDTIISSKTS